MKKLIAVAALALTAWSCTPQCESITSAVQTVCHRADAGTIGPNAPFVVEGSTSVSSATCSVTIDGGNISLAVDGMACARGNGSGFAEAPSAPVFIKCTVPALPAGTYVFTTSTPVTFTLPESADAGIPSCL